MSHSSNDFVVYSYTDPREKLPFYIGKGRPNRPSQHLFPCFRYRIHTHFYHRLNKILDIDHVFPDIKIIAASLTNSEACEMEIALIKQYGRLDIGTGCLYNHTNGGETGPGSQKGIPKSIETRIKMSKPKSSQVKANMKIGQKYLRTPVEAYDLQTGNTIKWYESQCAVKIDGYSQQGVASVLSGKQRSHRWLGWRYSEVKNV